MAQPPAPGSGHRRLDAFVGSWATEGEIKVDPGGKVRATDTYEWLPGGYFLLHRWDSHMPDGRTQGIEIIGFDVTSNTYSMHSFDSVGNIGDMRASVDSDTWTFEGPSLRFTGGFRDEGKTFAGVWEQRVSGGAEWLAWMDIVLSKVE